MRSCRYASTLVYNDSIKHNTHAMWLRRLDAVEHHTYDPRVQRPHPRDLPQPLQQTHRERLALLPAKDLPLEHLQDLWFALGVSTSNTGRTCGAGRVAHALGRAYLVAVQHVRELARVLSAQGDGVEAQGLCDEKLGDAAAPRQRHGVEQRPTCARSGQGQWTSTSTWGRGGVGGGM